MRYELDPFRIRVKMVEPGSIATEFSKDSKQIAVSNPYRESMNKFLAVFAKGNSAGARPEECGVRSFIVLRMTRAIGCVISPGPGPFSGSTDSCRMRHGDSCL